MTNKQDYELKGKTLRTQKTITFSQKKKVNLSQIYK